MQNLRMNLDTIWAQCICSIQSNEQSVVNFWFNWKKMCMNLNENNLLKKWHALFPTVIVKIWVPSSFEAQSSITVCFGAMALGALPMALMYFLTPSSVDKLGTDIKPVKLCNSSKWLKRALFSTLSHFKNHFKWCFVHWYTLKTTHLPNFHFIVFWNH